MSTTVETCRDLAKRVLSLATFVGEPGGLLLLTAEGAEIRDTISARRALLALEERLVPLVRAYEYRDDRTAGREMHAVLGAQRAITIAAGFALTASERECMIETSTVQLDQY